MLDEVPKLLIAFCSWQAFVYSLIQVLAMNGAGTGSPVRLPRKRQPRGAWCVLFVRRHDEKMARRVITWVIWAHLCVQPMEVGKFNNELDAMGRGVLK